MKQIDALYFIGAGGIGMSALIRYFLSKGKPVGGYDRTESVLTRQLCEEGAFIHYEDNVGLIPEVFKNKENTLVIYTPAVPDSHSELVYFRDQGFYIMKRAQLLGEITRSTRSICVAGTHGKTTTSSMIAHLLKQSHVDCNAFLGGILKNYRSNLLLSAHSDLTVIEADEYDRSFHWLTPYMAVITSTDPDHLDIYHTEEAYKESFSYFTSLIRENGTLLLKQGVDLMVRIPENVRLFHYSGNPENPCDFYARNIQYGKGEIHFDFSTPDEIITDIQLGVPIKINIENAVAAMAIAWLNGVRADELRNGMASFRGAERRFDFQLKTDRIVLIDDYAHHPHELSESINSVKLLFPQKKLTVIFQPHLYSRTHDFYKEFAVALSASDEVILLDIYPAREEPIPGVSSRLILDLVTSSEKYVCSKETLLPFLQKGKYEVVLMAGAGDIDRLVLPVKQLLEKKG